MNVEEKPHAENGNRQYKDSLFCFLFGKEERKEYTLSLFNFLNDTDYTDPADLHIMTLDNVLFINYRNDVACMVDPCVINLWEEQSSRILIWVFASLCIFLQNGQNTFM